MIFRIYVTDALQAISENLAKIKGGKTLNKRYYELINSEKKEKMNGEEIVANVIKNAGLEVIIK